MNYGEPITSGEIERRSGLDLLARVIYAEAESESEMGKRGVASVILNRTLHKKSAEFGGTTYKDVIMHRNAFESLGNFKFLNPDTNSQAWADSLNIALNMDTLVNPISTCLWFNAPSSYYSNSRVVNGREQYSFNKGISYTDVIEKRVLGGHIFFRLSGY